MLQKVHFVALFTVWLEGPGLLDAVLVEASKLVDESLSIGVLNDLELPLKLVGEGVAHNWLFGGKVGKHWFKWIFLLI